MGSFSFEPLTRESYALYGDVIEAEAGGPGVSANLGTAQKFGHLADLKNLRGSAKLNVAVFRCAPRVQWPFDLTMLERHAHSTQIFVPMNAARFLVAVARGTERPDMSSFRVFLARGQQAISYHPGTWHHPMIALDRETDFVSFVHEDASDADCDDYVFAREDRPRLEARRWP